MVAHYTFLSKRKPQRVIVSEQRPTIVLAFFGAVWVFLRVDLAFFLMTTWQPCFKGLTACWP